MRRTRRPSSAGSCRRRARCRLSAASAGRASTCRTTKIRKRQARISGRRICRRGRPRRGSARGRRTRCRRSPAITARARRRSSAASTTRRCIINADRSLRRAGVLGSVTHHRGKHVLKAGVEAARLSLHEDFSFFVTDEEEGEEADLSEGALEHDEDNPFAFSGSAQSDVVRRSMPRTPIQFGRGLTVDFGVRADRARMLARSIAVESAARRRVSRAQTAARRFAGPSTGSSSRRRPRICCSDRPRRRASCRRSSTRRAAAKTSSRSGSGRPSSA